MSGVWLTDLVRILRSAGVPAQGLTHKEGIYRGKSWKQVGWQGQGLSEFRGVMWHHDSSPIGDSPGALYWCMYQAFGYPPAANAWVDRAGKWWVYAAGRSNHAGLGFSPLSGQDAGNAVFMGVETDHTENEEWPQAQIDSLRLGTAAILRAYKLDPKIALIGHKEYAPTRKTDPSGLEMGEERRRVAKLTTTPRTGWRGLLDKWFARMN